MKHEDDKVIAFERAGLVFVFNFHSTKSFTDYRVGVDVAGAYSVVLSSDDESFGGHNRIDKNCKHLTDPLGFCNRRNFIQVYIPSRTAIVLAKMDWNWSGRKIFFSGVEYFFTKFFLLLLLRIETNIKKSRRRLNWRKWTLFGLCGCANYTRKMCS